MPESKKDKTRKNKVNNFKQKEKTKKASMQEQQNMPQEGAPQLPQVREIPTWPGNANIEMKGVEFETMYNGINEINYIMSRMFTTANVIMQRNLLNGTIGVNFEKLVDKVDENGAPYQDYEMMTEEEMVPHRENFNNLLEGLRKSQEERAAAPRLDAIVDANGTPVDAPQQAIVDATGQPVSSN